MPTMLEYQPPEQRQTTLVLSGGLLLLRLAVAATLFWMIQTNTISNRVDTNMLLALVLIYTVGSTLLSLATIKSTRLGLAKGSHLLDILLGIGLLWLIPNNATLGFIVPITMLSGALVGYQAFGLLLFAALLLGTGLASAYWHQTLSESLPLPVHGLQGLLGVMALLVSFRLQQPQATDGKHAVDLQTGLPYFSVLKEGFTYLLPYHQRNRIPLSLLLIRLPEPSKIRSDTLHALCAYVAQRLRKSDLMVRYDQRHLAVLLCDTNDHGAFLLAQTLQQYLGTDQNAPALHYAVLRVPLENSSLEVLLQKMQDTLILASQHNTDRVIFVSND